MDAFFFLFPVAPDKQPCRLVKPRSPNYDCKILGSWILKIRNGDFREYQAHAARNDDQ